MKNLKRFNAASDKTYEMMAAAFEEIGWKSVLMDLECEELYL